MFAVRTTIEFSCSNDTGPDLEVDTSDFLDVNPKPPTNARHKRS